jgi:hypothetical protein
MLSWLFPAGHGHSTGEELNRRLRRGLRRLQVDDVDVAIPRLARDIVWAELASLVGRLMATDLESIVCYGWQASQELVSSAQRTSTEADLCEVVTLADHTIRYADVAEVDVAIDEMVVVTVNVRVQADLHVTELALGIERGTVVNLRGGNADLTVRLFVQDDDIAHRKVDIDLEAELDLGTGLRLLPAPSRTPSER